MVKAIQQKVLSRDGQLVKFLCEGEVFGSGVVPFVSVGILYIRTFKIVSFTQRSFPMDGIPVMGQDVGSDGFVVLGFYTLNG